MLDDLEVPAHRVVVGGEEAALEGLIGTVAEGDRGARGEPGVRVGDGVPVVVVGVDQLH